MAVYVALLMKEQAWPQTVALFQILPCSLSYSFYFEKKLK
jgi:hypothetical protein